MNNFEIKTIIKDGLKKNHMSQTNLASLLGIERATVNRWCVGRAIPEADTFLKVCMILNIRLDPYLYKTQDPLNRQLFSICTRLSDKQKMAVLKIIDQVCEMMEDTVLG